MVGIIIAVGIFVLVCLFLVTGYNRLVGLRKGVRAAWAQIDVLLKRRHDLIPNLVETVKGYAAHESQTLQNVVAARNAAVAAGSAGSPASRCRPKPPSAGALRQVFALAEAYPDLKANTGFVELQRELADTENQIAQQRQGYNRIVADYNATMLRFPTEPAGRAVRVHRPAVLRGAGRRPARRPDRPVLITSRRLKDELNAETPRRREKSTEKRKCRRAGIALTPPSSSPLAFSASWQFLPNSSTTARPLPKTPVENLPAVRQTAGNRGVLPIKRNALEQHGWCRAYKDGAGGPGQPGPRVVLLRLAVVTAVGVVTDDGFRVFTQGATDGCSFALCSRSACSSPVRMPGAETGFDGRPSPPAQLRRAAPLPPELSPARATASAKADPRASAVAAAPAAPMVVPPGTPREWVPLAAPTTGSGSSSTTAPPPSAAPPASTASTARRATSTSSATTSSSATAPTPPDGKVEVGPRWPKQKHGAHAQTADEQFNNYGIGICLVGNFDQQQPSAAQLQATAKLVAYLMKTYDIPPSHVIGHGDTKATDCPGRYMHVASVRRMSLQILADAGGPSAPPEPSARHLLVDLPAENDCSHVPARSRGTKVPPARASADVIFARPGQRLGSGYTRPP